MSTLFAFYRLGRRSLDEVMSFFEERLDATSRASWFDLVAADDAVGRKASAELIFSERNLSSLCDADVHRLQAGGVCREILSHKRTLRSGAGLISEALAREPDCGAVELEGFALLFDEYAWETDGRNPRQIDQAVMEEAGRFLSNQGR
ncbi:hypothetical protein [Terrihabitans sp. B22-R8]|uniref:hypothetical protein n=1 Tax=Terrihabitans sp. B22-R8 TaxID=3425128 RepID=UPI00403D3D55